MPRARGPFRGALAAAALLVVLPATAQEPAPAAAAPVAAAPVTAQASEAPELPAEGRVLNGHVFMPSTLVSGPFATTSFETQMILIGGTTEASAQIGDEVFSGSLEYAGLGGFAGYELSFLEHFSVRAWLDDVVYSGLSGRSVVIIGTEVQAGFGAGATASLKLTDSLRLGALFDVSSSPSVALTILEALRDVVDSCESSGGCDISPGTAIEIENVVRVEPGVAVAWAPWSPLGIVANVTYVYVDGDGDTGTAQGVKLGGAVDFDLGPAVGFPLGLQGSVAWTAPVGSSGVQHVTDAGLGIFYTGRPNVSVGVQTLARRFSVQPGLVETSWSTYLTTIGLRYYW